MSHCDCGMTVEQPAGRTHCHECGTAEICHTVRGIQEIFYNGTVTQSEELEAAASQPGHYGCQPTN